MKKKLLALFLCCALSFGLVTAALITPAAADEDFLVYGSDGLVVHTVELAKNNKLALTAVASTGSGVYQWQIQVGGDVWANISGANGVTLDVSYALVANLLYGGAANLRCRLTAGEVVKYTNTVTVQITDETPVSAPAQAPKAPTVISEAEPVGEPVIIPPQTAVEETPAPDAAPANDLTGNAAPAALADPAPVNDPAPSDDGGEEPYAQTFTITISYVLEDGTQVAPQWSATAAEGSTFIQTVNSPVVLGYYPDEATVTLDYTDISKDESKTVIYYPSDVGFNVNHNLQNADNDGYTLDKTVHHPGLTGAQVGNTLEEANTYKGFIPLLYDATSEIAPDGSTVVDVYYDREYFLMNFDLDGGYGVEPIYARYGATIKDIGTPQKTGYTFAGWETLDGTPVEHPLTNMPLNGISYKAKWTIGDSAKVTVVVWGENPDDEGYSFYKNAEITAKPGEKLTLDTLQGKLICGKEEHTHDSSCGTNCAHTGTHTRTIACYGITTDSVDPNSGYGDNDARTHFENQCNNSSCKKVDLKQHLKDGSVCQYKNGHWGWGIEYEYFYFLYFGGNYYEITETQYNSWKTNTGKSVTHGNDTYYVYEGKTDICTHTHTESCYTCGKTEHHHTSACYYNTSFMDDPELWKMVKSDEITVAADGTSIMNVYYDRVEFTLHFRSRKSNTDNYGTITEKWGANIQARFKQKCDDAGTSNWSENKDASSPWTSYLDVMPAMDRTYYAYTKGSGTSTAYYYVEGLDGKDELFYENKSTGSGYTVTKEEFIEIKGFTFNAERSTKVGDSFNGAKFYYTRNSYELTFFNRTEELTDKTQTVKYEAPLKGYDFIPPYPSDLEANAYDFAGWYTTAGCFDGSEANLDTMTMPASNVILYAKWTPKFHTVKTYLTEIALKDAPESPLNTWNQVSHGTAVKNPPTTPENGQYDFVGWFYRDDAGNEKAFDFSMPVNRDLNLYAKWRSNTTVEYKIRYVLKDTETEIAPATTGSALAGSTKTFVAKTGDLLNEGYKTKYYPTVPAAYIELNINGGNEYKFEYVKLESISYTVRYLDVETREPVVGTDGNVAADKNVTTDKAVVTENFKRVPGYMPDAYQKQLVLSANTEKNVLIFWYAKDTLHAPVQIIHWVQNLNTDGYTEYQSSTDINTLIGTEVTENPLTIAGFAYNADKSNPRGTLTDNGLLLNLYYDRVEYPYEFRFLEYGTDKKLVDAESGKARYQARVSQTAKEIPGYTLVSDANQTINIAIEDPADVANKNVKVFYYTEQTVDIKYLVSGPQGCGTLSSYQDNSLNVRTGTPGGSTPTASAGFKFVGWFKDEACTEAADASWIGADNKLTPGKTKNYGTEETTAMGYEAATYYAKFEADVANLTITKQGYEEIDGKQSFIFTVTGPEGFSKKIVIQGNGTVVLTGLKIGTYTVTEDTAWSWRYTPRGGAEQTITLQAGKTNSVTYVNDRTNNKWLDGNAYCKNVFGTVIETDSGN